MGTIITVENLSKMYVIGHQRQGSYLALRDVIADYFKGMGKKISAPFSANRASDPTHEEFWALKDVAFDVKQGERIGIIGRNGAGKSTLLKILSRITEPTTGKIKIRGRVASLLEVGTGFHPELTGRENIYLNGAILGMTKAEIKSKFDAIVAFSEIEKFLDTPVKRYSSGMYVRLAFAVAAHLEPELLIIDEVLAVGDAKFQKKCLGKMEEVGNEGRTVLFVSHNMQAVQNLCPRTILLQNGKVIADDATGKSLSVYNQLLRDIKVDTETGINNESVRRGSGAIRFTSVEVQAVNGEKRAYFEMGETAQFKISYKVFKELQGLAVYIALRSGITREIVTSIRHVISEDKIANGMNGTAIIELPDIYARPGEYPLYFWIGDLDKHNFDVLDDLTAPLMISAESDSNLSELMGYFSIPSRVVSHGINP